MPYITEKRQAKRPGRKPPILFQPDHSHSYGITVQKFVQLNGPW